MSEVKSPGEKMNVIIYDLEIIKAIPNKDGSMQDGIEYCAGWHDHANMGISVNCAYDYQEDRYRVFTEDNKDEWEQLLMRKPIAIGFNSIPFDNAVLSQTGWKVPELEECYDILREMWLAAGLDIEFNWRTHGGYGLDATCHANSLPGKTGNGALAPVMWQQGQIGKVIDYCITDVHRTKLLVDRIIETGKLISAKTGEPLTMRGIHS